jgi:hypothetical protein
VMVKDGIYNMNGIPMLPSAQNSLLISPEYQVVIQDFGCLTNSNLADFLKADVKLLVLGAKDWELCYAEQMLNMVTECKDIIYLFNFMNGRQFQQIMKSMERKNSYRIPYEPDPFAKTTQKNGEELFRELFRPVKRLTLSEKAVALLVKGKNNHEA